MNSIHPVNENFFHKVGHFLGSHHPHLERWGLSHRCYLVPLHWKGWKRTIDSVWSIRTAKGRCRRAQVPLEKGPGSRVPFSGLPGARMPCPWRTLLENTGLGRTWQSAVLALPFPAPCLLRAGPETESLELQVHFQSSKHNLSESPWIDSAHTNLPPLNTHHSLPIIVFKT